MNHIQSPADGDQATELAIKAAGADLAHRVTLDDIRDNIASEHYFTAAHGCIGNVGGDPSEDAIASLDLLTFCVLVLKNGFTVTGNRPVSAEQNFNAEIKQAHCPRERRGEGVAADGLRAEAAPERSMIAIALFLMHCAAWAGAWLSLWL